MDAVTPFLPLDLPSTLSKHSLIDLLQILLQPMRVGVESLPPPLLSLTSRPSQLEQMTPGAAAEVPAVVIRMFHDLCGRLLCVTPPALCVTSDPSVSLQVH